MATLEDACRAVIAGSRWSPRAFSLPPEEVRRRVEAARRGTAGTAIRGLYAGGTLAHEAALILEPWLGPIDTNMSPRPPEGPRLSRPRGAGTGSSTSEPTSTPSRAPIPCSIPPCGSQAIAAAARDDDVGVLLLDVVLGLGAAADPAADLAPALEAARGRGRPLAIVLSVIGTAADPQGLAGQIARLERAGAWVLPSNAQAARAAACIAGPDRVMKALLTEARP